MRRVLIGMSNGMQRWRCGSLFVVMTGALAACAAVLPQPTSADLERARAEDPGVQLDDLARGRDAYVRRCSACHALRLPSERAPEAWAAEVARMQQQHAVRLTPDEERDILRYLRAASVPARQP
jgi:cytochrome c5